MGSIPIFADGETIGRGPIQGISAPMRSEEKQERQVTRSPGVWPAERLFQD